MKLTDIFIRRPVFSTVISLAILLIGFRAYVDLPVRQYPSIEASIVSVGTYYGGASAKLMEGFVTTPLERALSKVDGIDFMESTNTQGQSNISLHFHLGYDINKALTDVSNAVASARSELPKEIDSPIVSKEDTNANPTMFLSFSTKTLSEQQVSDYLLRVVQPQVATLPGVGGADIYSERQYAMRIWLNPDKMAAHHVTADEVATALNTNNVQTAAGRLEGKWQEFDVMAATDLNTPEQFNNIVIKQDNGYLIRLKDVGKAVLGVLSERSSAYINGIRTVVLAITPQPTANPLEVSKAVNKILPSIKERLPTGIEATLIWDSSKFIDQSIKEVRHTIIEAALCVILVIFLFLGSFRAVLIPVITIPLSLIGVCALMLMLGYTINILTLLAWVLAIGLVVDDAIVVLENIHRHIEEGMKPYDAAIKGAREIGFAVIAMTLTLAAVYAPIGFMNGVTGSLFREFAFTLASAVIISGIIALTLSPMMCSKVLRPEVTRKGFVAKIDEAFNRLMKAYQQFLIKVLNKKKWIILLASIIYIACYGLYKLLPSELAPMEDQGGIMTFSTGPTSANLAFTEKYTKMLEEVYKKVPDSIGYIVINGFPQGVNSSLSFLVLKPWAERKRTANEILQSLYMPILSIPGIRAFPMNLPPLPGSNAGNSIEFVIKSMASYDELNASIQKLFVKAQQNPKLLNLDTDLKLDKLQINIDVDRDKASDMGISANVISNTLNILLGEPIITRFVMEGRSYAVIPQLESNFRENASELNKVYVKTASGDLVPFSNIIQIKEILGPKSLNHFQQLRAAEISATPAPGYTLGEGLNYLKSIAKDLPKGMEIDYKGQSRQFIESGNEMLQTFSFALVFIFLVLAAQFESFRNPLIVMISVPLSLFGALLTMKIMGCSMNIYTQIGLVTLIGLITKHGILIVEFAEQLHKKGKNPIDSVIEAAGMRLRPIIMTTAAMVLGSLPLALASGAGSEARRQIGWVIIGGMSFGTFLTLFIVPTAYIVLAKFSHSKKSEIQ
ncbi:MAG: Efflux pump membrane transporter BepE [Legionellaceae bacterium]